MKKSDKSYLGDLVLFTALLGISTLVFIESLKLKPSQYEPLGPAAVPRALSVLLVLLAIPVCIQGIQKIRKNRVLKAAVAAGSEEMDEESIVEEIEAGPVIKGPQRPLLSLLTGISTVIYIVIIDIIGFRISTVILLLFLGTMLYRRERKGRPIPFFVTLFILAVGMSQLLFYVFTRILVVNIS